MLTHVPDVTFKTRIPDDKNADPHACDLKAAKWQDVTTDEIFKGKKVVVFALPGAFTPTCSSTHLPGYDAKYDELKDLGVDEVYCLSVNDAFVMNCWFRDQDVKHVKPLPDGNAHFTRAMGMLVKKENLGFGDRSWRYSMFVDDGEIKKTFVEPGQTDDCVPDPFEVSDVDTMIDYLKTLS